MKSLETGQLGCGRVERQFEVFLGVDWHILMTSGAEHSLD